jgi:hypothetical protein
MHPSASSGTVVPIPPKAPSNQTMERGGAPNLPQKPVAPKDLLDGGNLNAGRDATDNLTDLLDSAAISLPPAGSGTHNSANPFDVFGQTRSPSGAQAFAPQGAPGNVHMPPNQTLPQGHGQISPPPQQMPQNTQAVSQPMMSPGAPFGASQGAYPSPQPLMHQNQLGAMPGQAPNPPQGAGFPVHQHGSQPGFMPTPQQQIQHPQPGQGAPQQQPPFLGQNVGAVPHPFGQQHQQQQFVPPPQYSGQPTAKPPQLNMNQFDPFAKK